MKYLPCLLQDRMVDIFLFYRLQALEAELWIAAVAVVQFGFQYSAVMDWPHQNSPLLLLQPQVCCLDPPKFLKLQSPAKSIETKCQKAATIKGNHRLFSIHYKLSIYGMNSI